jgi:hypothetical protein
LGCATSLPYEEPIDLENLTYLDVVRLIGLCEYVNDHWEDLVVNDPDLVRGCYSLLHGEEDEGASI